MTVRRTNDNIDKWIGLSTDIKPIEAPVGSLYITEDNDDIFFRTKTNWGLVSAGALVSDHGALSGLADNDHTQYALLAGATFTGAVQVPAGNTTTPGLRIGTNIGFIQASANTSLIISSSTTHRVRLGSSGIDLPVGGSIGWHDGTNLNVSDMSILIQRTSSPSGIKLWDAFNGPTALYLNGATTDGAEKLSLITAAGDYAIKPEASGGGTLRGLVLGTSAGRLGFFGHAAVARSAAYTPSNVTPDRSYDADTVLVAELADVVGTIIADLQTLGIFQ